MSLLQDQRLRAVRWRDLTRLSFVEKIIENCITLPWLIVSLLFTTAALDSPDERGFLTRIEQTGLLAV